MHNIYPWQEKQWLQLSKLLEQGRLPHAILLNGPKDLGKRTFAIALAERLFCLAPLENKACGTCQGCYLMHLGTHPDFYLVKVDKAKIIKIEQIRELVDSLSQTPQQLGPQVVLIHPAEAMNIASSNALLKTLEEPQGNVVFLLVTHQMSKVLATIRSRCQRMDFSLPDTSGALSWLKTQGIATSFKPETLLKLAEGLPLRALKLNDGHLSIYQKIMTHFLDLQSGLDPSEAAADLLEITPEYIFNVLWSMIMDVLHLRHASPSRVIHVDQIGKLQAINQKVHLYQLFNFLDELFLFKQKNESKISVNFQLSLEALFIKWQRIVNEI